MKKSGWAGSIILLFILILQSARAFAQTSYNYIITAKNEELHFVSRPDLGYVVVSREETGAVEALDGTLRQFGARDIRAIRGLGRQGVSVVFSRRSPGENESTITKLRTQSQIKYVAPLFSSNEEVVAIIPEIVVRMNGKSDDEQLQALCQSINLRIKHKLQFTEREYLIEVLTTDANGVFDAVEQLNKASFVEWAVPNVAFRPQLLGQVIPNDTYFPNQWHLNNIGQSGGTPNADINAPEAWEITTGSPNIVIAVLDEGIDTDHPDLIDNIVAGYDFFDDDSNPNPSGNDAHGTACAGLIAAEGNNGIGVTGVAWNCKIMPIRISGEGEFITEADIATAIRWAANNGADVMSNSWGNTSTLPVVHSAIVDVTKQGGIGREGKGCVVLAASGNWVSGGSVIYPAKYSEVIAVGATDHNDVVWSYSGSGPELDIVAPSGKAGEPPVGNIWTTDIVGSAGYNNRTPSILDYTDKMGGTSGACPVAAGVSALVLSIEPNLTNIDVQDILQASAVDLGSPGFDNSYGYGRVDARSALEGVLMFAEQKWVARYNGAANWDDSANAIAVDRLGNVYVTGYSTLSGPYYDYATIKYDPNGNQLWAKTYNGPENNYDEAKALAVDDSGNVYVTGQSWGSGSYYDYATIKYDPSGNQLWVKRYNGSANSSDYANALAVDGLGNVYVTGYSRGSGTSDDYATIKYDPNGNELWVKRYNGPGNNDDRAYSLAVNGLGNVYVTGQSYGSGTNYDDYATIKYDPDGNEVWVKRYNGPGDYWDNAHALAVDTLGNVCVTGVSGSGGDNDYATIKYDPSGNQLWVKRYNGSANSSDSAKALVVDRLGNVYVTGFSYGSGTGADYATIKYDPSGNQLWVKRYNGSANSSDYANALAVDGLGNVYVTGECYNSSTNRDYATIKYGSNGKQLWVKRYNGSGNDWDNANALAIDRLGNVYVTGQSYGSSTRYDYVTIKYIPWNYCTAAIEGDLNCNCKVDFADFAILADDWLIGSDWNDLARLVANWLECNLAYQGACW
jgi:uncharacterized delta-60 repeat protein